MKKITSTIVFCFLLGLTLAHAQVNIQFLPNKEFNLTTDELINLSILSSIDEKIVDITITCKSKETKESIFVASLKALKINTQSNFISSKTFGLNIQYNLSSSLFNSSKYLKAGTYQVCVLVKLSNLSEEIANDCEEYKNFPLNPPMLLSPEDNATVQQIQPILNWIPPTPLIDPQGARYQLKLVQIRDNQNQFEAIASNSPILNTSIKSNTSIIYPINALPLAYGNIYAWQVEAFEGNVSLGKTEVWKFKIQRDSLEELKEKFKLNSFINISQKPDNNVYLTNEDLKIQIQGLQVDSAIYTIYNSNNKLIATLNSASILPLSDYKFVIFTENTVKFKTNEMYKLRVLFEAKNYDFVFKFIPNN